MTSISIIDAKFHKNPLFCLRDFQFFQTVVTNLKQQLMPAICSVSDFFTFQQDSTPAHRARETVALLSAERAIYENAKRKDSSRMEAQIIVYKSAKDKTL